MKRILVIGCGGSGKSTLSRRLGDRLQLPVIHLDQIWWKPGWVSISAEDFDAILEKELKKDSWIMDGNYNRTLPERLKWCDTVIYLDYNRFVCMYGMLRRVLKSYGNTRPDMASGCPERFDWEFVSWIWNYNKNNRAKNYAMLNDLKGVRVIILRNRRQAKNFLETIDK